MADSQRTKMEVFTVLGVIAAVVLGAVVGWFARGLEVGDLDEELAMTRDRLAEAETELKATGTGDGVADEVVGEAAETAAGGEAATGAEAPPATDGAAPPTVERQPGMVVAVTGAPGAYVLRIDYVLFLTGAEANAAATAHGDESPPPNGYYVVNDNPRIREFPIQSGIPVSVVTNDDGTSDSDGHTITLAQWVAALGGPSADAYKGSIYWITISDGTITAIEAQYVP
jgi:hypothetical protein